MTWPWKAPHTPATCMHRLLACRTHYFVFLHVCELRLLDHTPRAVGAVNWLCQSRGACCRCAVWSCLSTHLLGRICASGQVPSAPKSLHKRSRSI